MLSFPSLRVTAWTINRIKKNNEWECMPSQTLFFFILFIAYYREALAWILWKILMTEWLSIGGIDPHPTPTAQNADSGCQETPPGTLSVGTQRFVAGGENWQKFTPFHLWKSSMGSHPFCANHHCCCNRLKYMNNDTEKGW